MILEIFPEAEVERSVKREMALIYQEPENTKTHMRLMAKDCLSCFWLLRDEKD